jgi:hypothetical protein
MDSPNGVTEMIAADSAAAHHGHVPSVGTAAPPQTAGGGQPHRTQESSAVPLHAPERLQASGTPAWYPAALAAVVVVGFLVLTVLLMLRDTGIHEGHKDLVFMLFGGLVSGFSMVLSYFFGSSAGSAQKTAELAKIAKSR